MQIFALKDLQKAKEISEDDERNAETEVQKLTDTAVKQSDELFAEKQKELMAV